MVDHNPNHVQDARNDLLSVYQDRPRIEALIKSLAGSSGVQELEDDFRDLRAYHEVDKAVGEQLDQWGRLVNEPRGGLPDSVYQRFVKARIQANYAQGKREELIKVYAKITDADRVLYTDYFPAALGLVSFRSTPMNSTVVQRVRRMMEDIQPGGVELELMEAPKTDAFRFDTSGQGFNQGKMARVI